MAKFEDGVIGSSRGKIGAVVASKWRGVKYLRAKGPSRRNANSPKQKIQQAKFKVATKLSSDMVDLFQLTYSLNATYMTERNRGLAQIVKEAITGTYPNFSIDYSKVKISAGSLSKPRNATSSMSGGDLDIKWDYSTGESIKLANDRAIIVAYCPFFENVIYTTAAGMRSEKEAALYVQAFNGQVIHTWLAFISEDSTRISDSVYTGQFTVTI